MNTFRNQSKLFLYIINTQNKWKTTSLNYTCTLYIQGETTQGEPTRAKEHSGQSHPVRKHDRRETTRIPENHCMLDYKDNL